MTSQLLKIEPEAEQAPGGKAKQPLPFPSPVSTPVDGVAKVVEIAAALQTTLDTDKVVEIFARHVEKVVPHSGMAYRHEEEGIDILLGEHARHSCSYRLTLGPDSLGEITFMRRQRFASKDTERLEHLLCGLMYPLRNTLLYRHALRSAYMDPLTKVQNRAALEAALRREIDLAHRHGTPLSLIVLDIDYFKSINDTYGHVAGDCVLKFLIQCVARCVRRTDMVFRYGGEEFVVLLSNTTAQGAMRLAERIRRTVEKTECTCNGITARLTVSLGVAQLRHGEDGDAVFQRADMALYRAKTNGRNRIHLAEEEKEQTT